MKERPILFSAPMVRAMLDGSKTQTRRVVKFDDSRGRWDAHGYYAVTDYTIVKVPWTEQTIRQVIPCKFGDRGDHLWVRETWAAPHAFDHLPPRLIPSGTRFHYRASEDAGGLLWRPSIHMPRFASRISLEITGVRVERLQDISEADCRAEGCSGGHGSIPGYGYAATPLEHYHWLWNSINGQGAWESRPWIWAIEFRKAAL